MRVSTLATFLLFTPLLSSCQLPYLISGATEQIRILSKRTPIKKVIKSGKLKEDVTLKLEYALKASNYAEQINLNCKNNFKTFVKLDRPFVSYLVIASEKDELKLKEWSFPLVGSFPYLGFFSEKKALRYEAKLIKKNYDTFIRGASAYSSLGWFNEPILSSMIRGPRENLAETIFHECFHGTFFMKNNVELNEQLAVFVAHKSLLNFLKDFPNLILQEKNAWNDQKLFSLFLKNILNKTETYYSEGKLSREEIFRKIKIEYSTKLKPKLKVLNYDSIFLDENLNNAKLLAFKTYFYNFEQLETVFDLEFNNNIIKMINYFKALEKKSYKNKVKDLKALKLF